MLRPILLCVVLGGCGFQARATSGSDSGSPDGATGDGAGGGSGDGPSETTDCLQHWIDGTLSLSTPQELTGLSSAGDDRDPWLSVDGLRMYFASNRAGTNDIYLATRTATTQPFSSPALLPNLRTTDHQEDRASLTADELTLVLSSDRAGTGTSDIYLITRNAPADTFGTPLLDHMAAVNAGGASNYDPFLSRDGSRLYFAPDPPGGTTPQQIVFATRGTTGGDFGAPVSVPGVNDVAGAINADPAVTLDERIIMFTSNRSGGQFDLWYATRASPGDPFGTPIRIPNVNSTARDGDPILSADGCDLYLSSTRDDGSHHHLFHAQVTP